MRPKLNLPLDKLQGSVTQLTSKGGQNSSHTDLETILTSTI